MTWEIAVVLMTAIICATVLAAIYLEHACQTTVFRIEKRLEDLAIRVRDLEEALEERDAHPN